MIYTHRHISKIYISMCNNLNYFISIFIDYKKVRKKDNVPCKLAFKILIP